MKKTPKADLIERLEMRNMAADYSALWCRKCLRCEILPRGGGRKTSVTMHRGSPICESPLESGHLAECIRDLKGETNE